MKERRFSWIVFSLLGVAALALAIYACKVSREVSVVVQWSTASELDTVGFNLYRSETPDGQYQQVNQRLIPSSSDPLAGGNYTFEDKTVRPGHTYYYLLEDVALSGQANRNGPIPVEAKSGGALEFTLALALLAIAAYGLFTSIKAGRSAHPATDGAIHQC
jgi:hypothetical protein